MNDLNDAKVSAMLEGLKKALKISITQLPPGILIYSDSLGLVCNAGYMSESSNQKVYSHFKQLAESGPQTGEKLQVNET